MASLYVFMIIKGPLYVAVAGQMFSNYLDIMLVLINIHIINSISWWSTKTESIITCTFDSIVQIYSSFTVRR